MKAVLIHAAAPLLYIGAYGNEAVHTPALDRLAADSIVFDAHETDGGDAGQFLQTLLTGRHAFAARLENSPDLLTQLEKAGVTTALVSNRQTGPVGNWALVNSLPGEARMTAVVEAIADMLDRLEGFSDWLLILDLSQLEQDQTQEPALADPSAEQEIDLEEEIDFEEAILPRQWGEGMDDEGELVAPSATDIEHVPESDELAKPETETAPDDEDDEIEEESDVAPALAEEELNDPELQPLLEGQGETAAGVEDFDAFVGWLREEFEERGLWPQITLVLTGQEDSARPDGLCSAGPEHPLRPSVSRLPLIVRLPADAHAGRRVACLTQPADLSVTVSTLFGQPPAGLHGFSIVPLCEGQTQPQRLYACAVVRRDAGQGMALTTAGWKFLLLSHSEGESRRWLFRLPEDRFGLMDLYQQKVDYSDRLECCLQEYVAAADRQGPVIAPELPSEELAISTTEEGS